MNKGETRLFVAIMALLMLGAMGAGVYYFAQQHDYTYEQAEELYVHYDAETTSNEVEVNQTLYLKNTTIPTEDAWMVKIDFNPIDNIKQMETYGVNYASQTENDTATSGKFSVAINRSYVNSTHTYTCRIELYDAGYTLLIDSGDKGINSNHVAYYIASKDYSITEYHAKVTYDDQIEWITINVHNGVSADMF